MPKCSADLKEKIIDQVVTLIHQKIHDHQANTCETFCRQLCNTVYFDDLQRRSIDDLYGSLVTFWRFAHKRLPGERKIAIYNPDFEKHGWQSTHTIVQVLVDDMPFLVDSIRMAINRLGFAIHFSMHMGGMRVVRDSQHQIKNILLTRIDSKGNTPKHVVEEAPIYLEIDRQTDIAVLHELEVNLQHVLADIAAAVGDWQKMCKKVLAATVDLQQVKDCLDPEELAESIDFLSWIKEHHFTFLGVRDYALVDVNGEPVLQRIKESGLGVLREDMHGEKPSRSLSMMAPEARKLTLSQQILIISKTNTRSTVHRPTYTDYIGIKRFNAKGEVVGERRIIGLYTAAAYNTNPKHIPFLRRKVATIMTQSRLGPRTHAGKVLLNILETLPRDDLFQGSPEELLDIALGIYHLQERRQIRMFARKDVYGRFISCIVFVPRERFNTELRKQMQDILMESFGGLEILFSTRFSESILARIHFVVRIDPKHPIDYDLTEIEKKLIEVARTWQDELREMVLETFGEEQGNYYHNKYADAFSASYIEDFHPRAAVYDIKHIEQIDEENPLGMNFYRPVDSINGILRFKIYHFDAPLPLSDALPVLENMGLRVVSEDPYELKLNDGRRAWINDFCMEFCYHLDYSIDDVRDNFQQSFEKVWFGHAENDGFNELVLGAGLAWHEVTILRAYAKYLRQVGFPFSQEYIEQAFVNHTDIARGIVDLFKLRFDPAQRRRKTALITSLEDHLLKSLDLVANLDEDRILRRYLDLIRATLRTNYFQREENGRMKPYLSFKINSQAVPDIPLPLPMFEIFVYSPRFEGIHLRGGKVARGGLRWSDRREDFRTEVLGLMKAQQVKNAVIVPAGAKGGFVPKKLSAKASRDDILTEGIACYQNFIRGLLDLTDNLQGNEVVKPDNVVCYDEDDTYLVVAADKGTATFSDIANAIAAEYQFWLGDAFASGGSTGYDHKKMGITARGGWESVKRHFRELGVNVQTTDFTVVGVGDMAGDVFGNGMLLSEHICLLAAFNHMHIFVDPNPHAKNSFKERKRLFDLPRSSWEDYNEQLISKGGGVFKRSVKSIKISPEMKKRFDIKQEALVPNDFIKAILRSKVDLFWNGGIGTFVKASTETDNDVGDRTNDNIRVNANELRCRVVGEGGNLGLTQLARVEYGLNDGFIYTDFIDNSGGVDCSDHEVNIKILLNQVVSDGDLTEKQRNHLLAEMTEEVAGLVLHNNYKQTQAISLAAAQAARNVELHSRYIDDLEAQGKIARALEFLPDEKAMTERKLMGKGLTRPGIAVLLCYSKIIIKEEIINSDVPEDPYLRNALFSAFPLPIRERYSKELEHHKLRREIIATQVSNYLVNEVGFTFSYRLQDETGASVPAIVKAYAIAREMLSVREMWNKIDALDNHIPAQQQIDMMMHIIRLLRRTTRWILRNRRLELDIASSVEYFSPGVKELKKLLSGILLGEEKAAYLRKMDKYLAYQVPKELACELACNRFLFPALDIVELSHELQLSISSVASIYYALGDYLDLSWLRMEVIQHKVENHWEALSREALRDDLDWQQRLMTKAILLHATCSKATVECIEPWAKDYANMLQRWQYMVGDLRASTTLNYPMYFAAVRELMDITQTITRAIEREKQAK